MPSHKSDQTVWFTEEVQPHGPSLKAYLRGAYPSVRDVDDVVQESFLRVWKARMVRPVHSSKSFLFQVARNLALDFLRRERVAPTVAVPDLEVLPVLDERPGIAETASLHDEIAFLARAMHTLPPRCREVMMLRQIEGLSQKAIAAQLGISELTVQVQVVRGLRRLEAHFRREGLKGGSR